LVSARVSPRTCLPSNVFASFKINRIKSLFNHLLQHTFAVVFIVCAFDNFGLDFVLVVPAVLLDATGASSSVLLVSDLLRASMYALTLFNLSAPQVCFKNSWPA
jgi:hypothetical protein